MSAKAKLVLTVLLAACAASAIVADTASAEWFVNGTKLTTTTAPLATSSVLDTPVSWELPVPKIGVDCSGPVDYSFGLVLRGGNLDATTITWLHCLALPAGVCSLASTASAIQSEPLTATLTKGPGASEDRMTIRPLTKAVLATIPFAETEGGSCPVSGEQPVKGSLTVSLPKGQVEEATQVVEGLSSVENNSLEIAGEKIYVEGGRGLVKLASGSKWSFH
ncbi:MAG TPA: hypothetical protein VGL37_09140 [Solirubrobacteraceae bacterium]|jgi:hypothetical protein